MSKAVVVILLLLGVFNSNVRAELVVVGYKTLDTTDMTKKKIIDVYMGRKTELSEGKKLIPLDQLNSSDIKREFYKKLVNKSLNQIEAYWARLIFSGRAKLPKTAEHDHHVVELIIRNHSMIGYIDSSKVTADVKVILHVE